MEIKNKIITYIHSQNISEEKIASDTNISILKFKRDNLEDLNATELCVVCVYLGVDPNMFYEKKLK